MSNARLALQAARQAGQHIHDLQGDSLDVATKDDESPVTKADREASEIIRDTLLSATSYGYVDEETEPVDGDPFWLVDPLDGTKEFIQGSAEYTVNIALIRDGSPVLGVVHAPVLNTVYVGADGDAYKVEDDERTPLRYADSTVEEAIIAVSTSHPDASLESFLRHAGVKALRGVGSSLKGCRVADGTVNAYPRFQRLNQWDIGAMHGVIYNSDVKMTTWDDKPLRYTQGSTNASPFLAAPPEIHDDLLRSYQDWR